ncbi:MATE efflux family protein [Abeliophyllum distichum]|uniref:MATE efflux family protein n=1 Tax=Abeliophyllum distichum TaxID=126358 RepID=A0ABD1RTT0_9LAMI
MIEIIALTSLVLPIIGLCELGNYPQTTDCGVLRGIARLKVGANINLGCFYLVGMPVAVGLGFFLNVDFEGLWLGLLVAQCRQRVKDSGISAAKSSWVPFSTTS